MKELKSKYRSGDVWQIQGFLKRVKFNPESSSLKSGHSNPFKALVSATGLLGAFGVGKYRASC